MSDAHKKPYPLYASKRRPTCPVCGQTSYSSAGVHPQCAMAASDEVLTRKIKAQVQLTDAAPPPELRAFEKRCPRCKAVNHIRKRVCDCGYAAPLIKSP